MSLQTLKDQKGFTIVELLIVIVVIGILAAISIVAYTGVTARANESASKGNAESVQKAAEAYNASEDAGGYPNLSQINTGNSTVKIPAGVTIASTEPTAANGKTTIGYLNKGTTGACIARWDYTNKRIAYVFAGDAATPTPATGSTTGGAAITDCA